MPPAKPKARIPSFKEFLAEQELDHIVIEVPVTLIGAKVLLNEGKWMPSGKSGWMVRVDAANPAIKLQRHVAVARIKHVRTKNMQASWNVDGTRHDKKTFDDKAGSQKASRQLARQVLDLPDKVVLEHVDHGRLQLLTEENSSAPAGDIFLRVRPIQDSPRRRSGAPKRNRRVGQGRQKA